MSGIYLTVLAGERFLGERLLMLGNKASAPAMGRAIKLVLVRYTLCFVCVFLLSTKIIISSP